LRLLVDAGRRGGWVMTVQPDGSVRCQTSRNAYDLRWPPGPLIPKSLVSELPAKLFRVSAVTTARVRRRSLPPSFPVCVKPDIASNARGFRVLRSEATWRRFLAGRPRGYVVQPLLKGTEYRVTVCADGVFAAARMESRRGGLIKWRDVTGRFPLAVVSELQRLVRRLRLPGAGFDLIVAGRRCWLLDVNAHPSLAVHVATAGRRDIASAFLRNWIRRSQPV
jgi:hypothetical protein